MGCGQKAASDYYADLNEWNNRLTFNQRESYKKLENDFTNLSLNYGRNKDTLFSYIENKFLEDYDDNVFNSFKTLRIKLLSFIKSKREHDKMRNAKKLFEMSTGHP